MAKVKYHYNPETLSYSKITPKKGRYLKHALLVLLSILLTGFLGFVILINFFESPKEKAMIGKYEVKL